MALKRKMLPCPSYDIAALETWLSDLAESGLFLAENGLYRFTAVFETGEPKTMTYRFEPASYILETDRILDENSLSGKTEFLEEAGWKHLCSWRMYMLFAHEGYAELHTDSETEAPLRMDMAKARTLALMRIITRFAIVGFLYSGNYMQLLIQTGSWLLLLGAAFALISTCGLIFECVSLYTASLKMKNGTAFTHEKDWRKNAAAYRLFRIMNVCVYVLLAFCILASLGDEGAAGRMNIAEYTDSTPFLTVRDIDPDAEYSTSSYLQELVPRVNTVRHYSDMLSHDNYIWQEIASLKKEDKDYSYSLNICYYDTEYEFCARRLFQEYCRQCRGSSDITSELSGADACFGTADTNGFVTFVFRKGNKTVFANVHMTDMQNQNDSSPSVQLAQMLMDSVSE